MPEQFEVPVGFGHISGQIFGNPNAPNSKPLLALHGILDNSNSFRPISKYLTKDNNYYIIAIDLPGMGFSSKIPDGIPYSTKFYVMSIRRVVNHFNLDKFVFLTHSFGCTIALAYSACFSDQVLGLALLDMAMRECDIEFKDNLAECWKEGIETYLTTEKKLQEKKKTQTTAKELTYEHALKRLLESNKHIDENAAKILLERGLTVVNNQYEYSRDIRLITGISIRDYHAEYVEIYRSLFENLKSPIFLVYATPPPYGQKIFDQIMQMMSQIKEKAKAKVDMVPIEGTHHFHMLKPLETTEKILQFLNEKYSNELKDLNNNQKKLDSA